MKASHKHILRASSILGAASVINIALAIVRMKVAAHEIGPAGIGQIGILQNLVAVVGAVVSLGIGASASRRLALPQQSEKSASQALTRHALLIGTAVLAIVGAALTWLARDWIATSILSDESLSEAVGWMAPAVAATIIATTQTGLLAGLKRVGDIGRSSVLAGTLATIVVVPAIFLFPSFAAILFVLLFQAATLMGGSWYVARLSRPRPEPQPFAVVTAEFIDLVRLGVALTIGGLFAMIGPLLVRATIGSRLGDVELGLFHASWAIGAIYLAIVLQAMSADYLPRLSAEVGKPAEFERLINEQTEVALLVGAPIILVGMGGAPLILHLLYGGDFLPAASLLRWQMLADVLKVASWPLGFALIALGRGTLFVLLEACCALVFVGATKLLLGRFGLDAAGVAYFLVYAFYLPMIFVVVHRVAAVRWSTSLMVAASSLAVAAAALKLIAYYSDLAAALASIILAALFSWRAWHQLTRVSAG